MTSIREIIQMNVVGAKGTKLGTVIDVEINLRDLTIEGLLIKSEIFTNDIYIWKNYIEGVEHGRVMMTFDLETLEDRDVYDKFDKKLGIISSVDGKGKDAVLTVHIPDAKPSGRMGLHKPELVVPITEIISMGPHIIVDITKSRAEKYVNQERAEI